MSNVFKKRIIHNFVDDVYYYMDSISLNDNFLKVMRLYDSNNIKINLFDYYIKKGVFQSFPLKEFKNQFRILSVEEGEKILKNFIDNENYLKIFYSTEEREDFPGGSLSYYPGDRSKKYVIQKVLPEGVTIDDYDIDYVSGISDVRNRKENLKVVFKAEEIKDEIESLPPSLQIYYTLYDKTLNVLHVNTLDPSIDISKGFEVYHLERNENINTYRNFEYKEIPIKILFKNFKILKIFVNVFKENGENVIVQTKAEEFFLKNERLVKIKAYYPGYYAKIKKLPLGVLAKMKNIELPKPKEEDYILNYDDQLACDKSISSLKNLSVMADVEIIYDDEEKYLDLPIKVSLPVYELSLLPMNKEIQLDQRAYDERQNRSADEIKKFESMCEDIRRNYEKYFNDYSLVNDVSKDDLTKYVKIIENYKNFIPITGAYVEKKEMWSYLEVNNFFIYILFTILENLLHRFDSYHFIRLIQGKIH